MITLQKAKGNVEICKLKTGKKHTPVYWNPIRNPQLRNSVSDVSSFNTEMFRDKFRLSQNQADEIISHLKANTTPENHLQSVFFKVKRFVEDSLYTQMILTDNDNQELVVDFPEGNDTWPGLALLCGASNCGKTYTFCNKIKRNLDGPSKHRRNFIIVSSEWNKDCTLTCLKHEKYRPWITGIDVSECSLRNSLHATPAEFFKHEVQGALDFAEPGTCCVLDDPMDSACASIFRRRINKMCRCSRHDKVGLIFILHKIANHSAFQNIKHLTDEYVGHHTPSSEHHLGGGIHEAIKTALQIVGGWIGGKRINEWFTGEKEIKPISPFQQDIARLIQGTYQDTRPETISQWSRIDNLDTEYGSYWTDSKGHYVLTVRGTKLHWKDIYADLKIAGGSQKLRDGSLEESMQQFNREFPHQKLIIGAHSLGTQLAWNGITSQTPAVDDVYLFNPASSPFQHKSAIREVADSSYNVKYFLNTGDVVSNTWGQLLTKQEIDDHVQYGKFSRSPLASHGLSQWVEEN